VKSLAKRVEKFGARWGSTYGSITSAVEKMQSEGAPVSSAHLRHLIRSRRISVKCFPDSKRIVPEMNLGQLCTMIRARYLIDAIPFRR